jgi:predicted CXXCH cytochrome family protein
MRGLLPASFCALAAAVACRTKTPPSEPSTLDAGAPRLVAPSYVGSASCRGCHAAEFTAWSSSQHQAAMAEPSAGAVLGDFAGREQRYFGEVTRFRKSGERHQVEIEGRTLDVKYTFGVRPLQQYLVEVGDGRLQALPFAYDTRPQQDGGARWFHLHPKEHVRAGDELHWMGPAYNWNKGCADCHSTDLRRNYDATTRRYATAYSEISVGCEACHGPGSGHVADGGKSRLPRAFSKASWQRDEGARIAHLASPRDETEIDACGPCHSRRSELRAAGSTFHDRYRLELLLAPLYFDDGQIKDEVFELGSFLQSKMHVAGVTCSDCHEPHSGSLRASGNELCGRCHSPAAFDTPEHHFHTPKSAGSACVDCHMPARTYMEVDPRRDHRFGLPRPDLSLKLGVPNACSASCHGGKLGDRQAAQKIKSHFGGVRPKTFAEAFHAARHSAAGAERELLVVAADQTFPPLVRATALFELQRFAVTQAPQLATYVNDPSPLVRRGLVRVATGPLLATLLSDSALSVRLEAATALLDVPEEAWSTLERSALARIEPELRLFFAENFDRPEPLLVQARLEARRAGGKAGELYDAAIALDPTLSTSYVEYAAYLQSAARDREAAALLERGIASSRDDAPLEHALGLTLVRLGDKARALAHLERAHELAPDVLRFGYVRAVALFEAGKKQRAISILEQLQRRFGNDEEVTRALAAYKKAP